jgi:preprotein translocase subunit YajC
MALHRAVSVAVLALAVAASAFAWMGEGTTRGTVIVVGEDRLVVQAAEGGQMTFEVAMVKDGDQWVKNGAQLAQLKTIKQGATVEVHWGRDHTNHYYIIELKSQEGPGRGREGLVQGKVVTASEGRIVVAATDGSQMTLEPSWVRRNNQSVRDPSQVAFASALKPGDEIVALWGLDGGTPHLIHGVAKVDPAGQALGLALTQAELREAYQQIDQLQQQIRDLRRLIEQGLRALAPAQAQPAAPH